MLMNLYLNQEYLQMDINVLMDNINVKEIQEILFILLIEIQ